MTLSYLGDGLHPVVGGAFDGDRWPHYRVDRYHFGRGDYVFERGRWVWRLQMIDRGKFPQRGQFDHYAEYLRAVLRWVVLGRPVGL